MVDRFVSGHDTCRGLSDLGHEQAMKLRERLLRTGELRDATAMFTSILPRAIETAGAIVPAVGDGLVASEHCDWCEQHPGEGEGLGFDEYDSRYGVFNEGEERDRVRAPGSESVAAFVRRVEDALLRVIDDHEGETIVIVCHGGVINCALEVLAGIPFGTLTRHVDNTSLTELERDIDGDKWWMVRLNDAAHLAKAPSGWGSR
jgi:probable phosphoglycerate mutase